MLSADPPAPPRRSPWPLVLVLAFLGAGLAVSLFHAPLGDQGVEADFFAELAPAAQRIAAGRFDPAAYTFGCATKIVVGFDLAQQGHGRSQ